MSLGLVTGASGLIGGRPCRRPLSDGDEVHPISRRPQESEAVCWRPVDLGAGDADLVASTLERLTREVVYHLADTPQDCGRSTIDRYQAKRKRAGATLTEMPAR